jgi:hypothetical protein
MAAPTDECPSRAISSANEAPVAAARTAPVWPEVVEAQVLPASGRPCPLVRLLESAGGQVAPVGCGEEQVVVSGGVRPQMLRDDRPRSGPTSAPEPNSETWLIQAVRVRSGN